MIILIIKHIVQLAYMEKLRSDKLNACATILQKNVRGYLARLRYLRVKNLILALQSIARRQFAKYKMELIRKEHAATVIQTNWRRYVERKRYLQTRMFVVHLQAGNYSKHINFYVHIMLNIIHSMSHMDCQEETSGVKEGTCSDSNSKSSKRLDGT
jgi:myosin heavy subunit